MNNLKLSVEDELKKGLEATSQLKSLLAQSQINDGEHHKERILLSNERTLVENYSTTIINSFDTSIAILKKIVQSMEVKPSSTFGQAMDTCQPKTRLRMIETPCLTPDGYTWRKYGKKSIRNTKYPKDYYRCAYKQDLKCEAIKHVQKISDTPTKYRITYYAQHTCQTLLNNINTSNIHILNSIEKDGANFTISTKSKNPIPLITQNPNHALHNPPSISNNDELPSLLTMDHPSHASTSIIKEPILADDTACFNYPEQLFSPTISMSPNYYMTRSTVVEDYSMMMVGNAHNVSDASLLLQDLPLWE